jgi:hypothetical protein
MCSAVLDYVMREQTDGRSCFNRLSTGLRTHINMVTAQKAEVVSGKFNALRICTG